MAKNKTQFECISCGYQSAKWLGKCPQCDEWNSFEETIKQKSVTVIDAGSTIEVKLSDVESSNTQRFSSNLNEFDYVLGGGIVSGSSILLGGAPGIGKSTLVLQLLKEYGDKQLNGLYFCGEEAPYQIKLRAERLNCNSTNITLSTEIELNEISRSINRIKPAIVIIDSIQTIYNQEIDSGPGSIVQIRDCTFKLVKLCKELAIPVIIIGHITKEGQIAGPKILEHMVDVVLYFEGDQYSELRLLRSNKNRYGTTNEIALFKMTAGGLKEESDLNRYLSFNSDWGMALSCIKEGSRYLIVEIQALVSRSSYGMPQRVTQGIDQKRLNVIIAVLEKKAGLFLGDQDVFVKVSAAIKVTDPIADMAIAAAIWSSFANKKSSTKTVYLGELSLTGQFQKIQLSSERLREFKKYGFDRIIANSDKSQLNGSNNLRIVESIDDLNDLVINHH
ncbi:MAG: DNA repair protein RadA [Calditrichaeota bacterium]|nr:DNA repair protein RadA [Calditrichota bacterium]